MKDLENNKLFAALLVGVLVATGAHIVSEKMVNPAMVKAPGAEAAADAGGAEAAPEQAQPIDALIAKGDVTKGQQVAKVCAACHTFDKGGANGVGPNLWNVFTRGRAAEAGYSYSDAMAKHKGEAWNYLEVNKWLWSPSTDVPGTKMTFAGVKKAQDRANLVAYLRTLGDSPFPEPSAADDAAEAKALGGADVKKENSEAKPGAPATAPNNTSAPAGQGGAAATPVTKGKPTAAKENENPLNEKSSTPQQAPENALKPAGDEPSAPHTNGASNDAPADQKPAQGGSDHDAGEGGACTRRKTGTIIASVVILSVKRRISTRRLKADPSLRSG